MTMTVTSYDTYISGLFLLQTNSNNLIMGLISLEGQILLQIQRQGSENMTFYNRNQAPCVYVQPFTVQILVAHGVRSQTNLAFGRG